MLDPDAETLARVKTTAVSLATRRRPGRRLAVAMAVLVAIGGVGYNVWQSSLRETETVAVLQSADDLVLVVTPDGRQWVLGPSRPAPAPGTMELVIEGGP